MNHSAHDRRPTPGAFEDRLLVALHHVVAEEAAGTGGSPSPDRRVPRRPRPTARVAALASAAGGLVAAAAVAAIVVGTGATGPAAPRVPAPDAGLILLARTASDGIQVLGLDAPAREDLPEVLRAAGVAVEVSEVPASPSLVGLADGLSVDDGPGLTVSGTGDRWTIDPAVYRGTVVVTVFREPGPDEEVEAFGSAFAEGEPLAGVTCGLSVPFTADALAQAAADSGVTLRWSRAGDDAARPGPPPPGRVASAQASSEGAVDIQVVEPADPAYDPWPEGLPLRTC